MSPALDEMKVAEGSREGGGQLDPATPSYGCLAAVLAAASPFAAAAFVYGRTVDPPRNLAGVPETFLAWLALPGAVVVSRLLRRRTPRLSRLLPGAAALLLVVVTAWIVRPQAPTGRDHEERLEEGVEQVGRQLRVALERTVPGRWQLEEWHNAEVCTDAFGRDRGAAHGGHDATVTPGLTLNELEGLRDALSREQWVVNVSDDTSYLGGAAYDLVATRNGYTIHAGPVWADARADDQTEVSASTPCLRLR